MISQKTVKIGFLSLFSALTLLLGCAEDQPETCVFKNECGGCQVLAGNPGESCGNGYCGIYLCDGLERVKCEPIPTNSCGGCEQLEKSKVVGTHCGVCGKYECSGSNSIVCNDPGRNNCGGCMILPGKKGEKCGVDGKYVCNGIDALICQKP